MSHVCVGIYVHTEPWRLKVTLDSLRAHTRQTVEIILLPDGPDDTMQAALEAIRDWPQLGTAAPLGPPACFNRLAVSTPADVLVLLEGGAQVGPQWLDYLLAALDSDSRNGLAGPSTNVAWNEQAVFPEGGSTLADIERTAEQAAQRFGFATRTLEPLYSLADFCYVVHRKVVQAIGAADAEYGLGPCWEMDYNIRAARGGYRGVWACGAYVHRAPFTDRRRREEVLRFEASKRRYQDKFCGLRLRGEKTDYRTHCRGDACPNYAPPALIEILPPPAQAPPSSAELAHSLMGTPSLTEPLVSCIMPTYNRRAFVPQAIQYFLRQDYPNLELVIVDDGTDPIADQLPEDRRVRYIRLGERHTIGTKRNLACSHARGDFIVHWDDDDWYPSWRVRVQVRALLDRSADLCGSSQMFFYDVDTDRAWRYQFSGEKPWVGGSTLAYRKSFWARQRFPDIQIGEDTRFIWEGPEKIICDMADPTLCVSMIHSANTSRKSTGGAYWHPQPSAEIHALLGGDLHFYRKAPVAGHSEATELAATAVVWPLISCIMPTYNRRPFIRLALQHFMSQDYPNKELLIIDDGTDPIGDLTEGLPGIQYTGLHSRMSIGGKRNLACQQARGELIAHWDDDDWYAPNRLSYQAAPILAGDADMTGLENAFLMELPGGAFWKTHPQLHQRMFIGNVHGGTLVYRKPLLEQGLRYPEINLAEDATLIHSALNQGKRLLRLANPGVFVYVRHGRNAWQFQPGRFLDPAGWERGHPPPSFPSDGLRSYRAAAEYPGAS